MYLSVELDSPSGHSKVSCHSTLLLRSKHNETMTTHTHYNWEFGRLISFHGCLNDNENVIMPAVVKILRCNFAEGKKYCQLYAYY